MKKSKIWMIIFSASALLFAAAAAQADEMLKAWEWKRPIQTDGAPKKAVAVALDEIVHGASRADLADVRIASGSPAAVPYMIFSQEAQRKEKKLESKIIDKKSDEKESVWTLDLGKPSISSRLELVPKAKNFAQKVTVQSSDDGEHWKFLAKALVYSFNHEERATYLAHYFGGVYSETGFSRYFGEQHSVSFPETQCRYLRVTMSHPDEMGSVELEEIGAFHTVQIPAEEDTFAGKILKMEQDPSSKSTEITVDFGHENLPLSRVDAAVSQSNFFRNVEILSSNDGQSWERAGEGTLFSISLEDVEQRSLSVSFSPVKGRYLKLKIRNGDSASLRLDAVTAHGLKQFAVFLPDPKENYFLFYGNPHAPAVNYDLPGILSGKTLQDFGRGTLGRAERSASYQPWKEEKPWTEDRPYLLWAGTGAILLGILFLAFQVVKKVDEK